MYCIFWEFSCIASICFYLIISSQELWGFVCVVLGVGVISVFDTVALLACIHRVSSPGQPMLLRTHHSNSKKGSLLVRIQKEEIEMWEWVPWGKDFHTMREKNRQHPPQHHLSLSISCLCPPTKHGVVRPSLSYPCLCPSLLMGTKIHYEKQCLQETANGALHLHHLTFAARSISPSLIFKVVLDLCQKWTGEY